MDLKTGTLLVPPTVKNSSCSHPRYSTHNFIIHIGIAETIEALLILILTLGVIGANALVIFVINNRRYSPYIHQQPRYLLTSLALNDLTIGLLITPFGLLPALFHCWPYGEIFCQIQALLRGALSQQSAVILVCMAVDRYMCALHPRRYYQHSSKKGCVAILSLTWIISLTVFGFLVLPKGYYFNGSGLMACEPFYSKPSYRILATCALYFPTTMVLMYCYGSSFHMSRFRLNDPTMPLTAAAHHPHHHHHALAASSTLPSTPVMNLMSMGLGMAGMGGPKNTITKKIVPIQEKNSSGSTSRSMAAISLGFIVMVTPWTIQEIVTACTGSKLPPFLDFLVTWTALSNSLWNPFMYWLLNSDFRRLSRHLMPNKCFPTEDTPEHKSACCHNNSDFEITTLPMPPEPPTSRPPGSSSGIGGGSVLGICARARTNSLSRSASQYIRGHHHGHSHHGGFATMRPDIEGLSEKYWGEILERTVSSGSLHAMQKSFPLSQHHHHHHNTPATMTTSFSKHSDLNLTISEHEREQDGASNTALECELSKFSNSEPKLCEHIYHDANCAKNKSAPNGASATNATSNIDDTKHSSSFTNGRNIPDI
ncbi:5-hydroxytryptamine receptor 1D-like [Teleopsis dalmanni]|uniref:5-hydroxytryptamine receptor 1D-like n=1 Tax=Teleopsis dalmanni TaxID=139649 RepID=UPI0018CF8A27|nr:5-hydroxytryptamine receptor 1D-like [Teleopsis dalmanni]XP_037956841.1 5-hydroxytryptamine receptor 1D-like [Teleopsis dalmanni]